VRDHETGLHLIRTKLYVKELATELSLNPKYASELTDEAIDLMSKTSVLHDIGKVGIPDSILLKPDKLTAEEFEIMKTHAIKGKEAFDKAEQLSGRSLFSRYASEIVFTHHERWDGTGYPQGLKGDEIPLCGRIMAVADVYDALISTRAYKKSLSHEQAVEIISEGSGSHFDPDIIDAFYKISRTFKDIARSYNL
jgi:putative two-component system response regulator